MSISSALRLSRNHRLLMGAICLAAATLIMSAPAHAQHRGHRDGARAHAQQSPPRAIHRLRHVQRHQVHRPQIHGGWRHDVRRPQTHRPPHHRPHFGYRAPAPAYLAPAYLPAYRPVYQRPGHRWVSCAREGSVCYAPYPTTVRYGAHGRFAQARVAGPVDCSNYTFGDPIYGVAKSCSFLAR
ncbi:MAG: hypothetical protein K2X62_07665 [Beijerinckiaceae bacterium]|nr:hypothetical protein [Beijerinckiaceae bacterium]